MYVTIVDINSIIITEEHSKYNTILSDSKINSPNSKKKKNEPRNISLEILNKLGEA